MKERKDHFTIRKICRTYDRTQGKFSVNIAYETKVENASTEKTTHLIKTFAILLQTKIYLFWQTAKT
jgi:hypothetical protein